MTPDLLPWAEVPEGHYVWFRWKGFDGAQWHCGQRRGNGFVTAGGPAEFTVSLYEFARAEQGPKEGQ